MSHICHHVSKRFSFRRSLNILNIFDGMASLAVDGPLPPDICPQTTAPGQQPPGQLPLGQTPHSPGICPGGGAQMTFQSGLLYAQPLQCQSCILV